MKHDFFQDHAPPSPLHSIDDRSGHLLPPHRVPRDAAVGCVFSRKRAMGSMKHHRTRERGADASPPSFPLLNGTLWIVRGALKEGAGGERGRERGREGKSPMLKRKSVSIGCQKPTLPPLPHPTLHSNPPLSIKPKGGDHLHHCTTTARTRQVCLPSPGRKGRGAPSLNFFLI